MRFITCLDDANVLTELSSRDWLQGTLNYDDYDGNNSDHHAASQGYILTAGGLCPKLKSNVKEEADFGRVCLIESTLRLVI